MAQNVISDPASIDVSELSDAQIQALVNQQDTKDISDDELIQGLVARGMSPDQARELQNRLKNARLSQSDNDTTTKGTQRRLNYKPDTTTNPRVAEITLGPKIFGADLFRSNNNSFEPNLKLATPTNYVLGPDDQLGINVYGASVANWTLNVSPDGRINIPGSGLLSVTGKTIEQATAAIKARLIASNYAIGRGTNLSVTLGNIRSIKVILVGEVVRPGTYTLPSLATVFNALYVSGGPNDNGTFRQIEVIR
ncbi:MAG: polysaccharide biosynthesis/export family protein, partial [Mucilaginibacter sp.]